MSKLVKVALATLLVSLALALPANEANALGTPGSSNCNVFNVQFESPWSTSPSDAGAMGPPALVFHCSNNGDPSNYSAYYGPVSWNCPTLPLAQVQVWNSMLSAAYISGKQVTVTWIQGTSTTCPDRSVTSINLSPPG